MSRRVASWVLLALLVAACSVSATPAPSGTAVPSALPAGTYTSKVFKPTVTFTLPAGWDNPQDTGAYFELAPAGSDVVGIHLFRDPVAASQDAACPESPEPGVARTSTALLTWIRDRPGLVVSPPKLVTVGGLRGVEIDLAIKDGWESSCPFANGIPTVPLLVGANGEFRWVVAGTERLRLDLLDAEGGGTLIVDIDAFDGSLIDSLLAAASPIVRSMSFAGG